MIHHCGVGLAERKDQLAYFLFLGLTSNKNYRLLREDYLRWHFAIMAEKCRNVCTMSAFHIRRITCYSLIESLPRLFSGLH